MHFKFDKSRIHSFESVSSTMDIARQMAEENCPDRTVIVAKHQTCGRGRMKRNWQSDQGGLYMTWVLRPKINISLCFAFTFSSALSIVEALEKIFKIKAEVKWPNDVLVNGHKIAGILTETKMDNNELNYLNIGMGININNIPNSNTFQATSIKDLIQKKVNTSTFIDFLFDKLDYNFQHMNPKKVIQEWKARNCTLGKFVRVKTFASFSEGYAIDIDNSGALLLEKENGEIETVIYGDCFEVSGIKFT